VLARRAGRAGRNLLYQFLFVEEMEYWGMPYGNLTYTSIGPSINHFGSEEQKKRWLPGIWSGEYTFAIGYSEPNAGTDLAALRTRGVRVGDEWVINGQKIWTSLADVATHIWLAVRTDPDLPKHQGISVFVVPTDVQGLTIRPLHAMYGGHTCETFYDDVRVPHANLVGGLNRGWGIVMHALNHERVGLAATGGLARLFDQLVALPRRGAAREAARPGGAAPARRARARSARAPLARAAQRVDHLEGRHADRRGVDGEGVGHRAAHADRQHRDGPARPLRRALEGERRARARRGPHGVGVPDLADLPLRRRHQRVMRDIIAGAGLGCRDEPRSRIPLRSCCATPCANTCAPRCRSTGFRALEREQRGTTRSGRRYAVRAGSGLPFAEARGGGGGTLVDAGVLIEEVARRAAIVPLVEAIACGAALERHAPGVRTTR
jgi:alkylation response protein AidB-like acyl-CoA dehydrogenase